MTGCRIGRVKIKGGADIRILPSRQSSAAEEFFKDAVNISRENRVLCAGYFIVSDDFVRAIWHKGDGGLFTEMVGATDWLKEKIMDSWKDAK